MEALLAFEVASASASKSVVVRFLLRPLVGVCLRFVKEYSENGDGFVVCSAVKCD